MSRKGGVFRRGIPQNVSQGAARVFGGSEHCASRRLEKSLTLRHQPFSTRTRKVSAHSRPSDLAHDPDGSRVSN